MGEAESGRRVGGLGSCGVGGACNQAQVSTESAQWMLGARCGPAGSEFLSWGSSKTRDPQNDGPLQSSRGSRQKSCLSFLCLCSSLSTETAGPRQPQSRYTSKS